MTEELINCREALDRLQDYLHQESTPELARQIEAHLAACAPCLRHARFEKNFQALLGATAADVRCPDALRERVREALRRASQTP